MQTYKHNYIHAYIPTYIHTSTLHILLRRHTVGCVRARVDDIQFASLERLQDGRVHHEDGRTKPQRARGQHDLVLSEIRIFHRGGLHLLNNKQQQHAHNIKVDLYRFKVHTPQNTIGFKQNA